MFKRKRPPEQRLEQMRHDAALQINLLADARARGIGVHSIIDVSGSIAGNAAWTGRTLPANVAVLSVTTVGEIASDKDDRTAPELAFTGTATRAAAYQVAREVVVTMALLEPRWAFALMGIAGPAATDRRLSLSDLVSARQLAVLVSAMRDSSTAQSRSEVLVQWLQELAQVVAADPRRIARLAVGNAAHRSETGTVSLRQRERTFLRDHGVSMSRFRSIERFQKAVTALARGESGPALALDAGYVDQSHMCRYVRSLSGLAPTRLAQELSDGIFTDTYAQLPGFARHLVV